MKKQIEILRQMQVIELEAGFPNGELYNELEDKITIIKINDKKAKKKSDVCLFENQLR